MQKKFSVPVVGVLLGTPRSGKTTMSKLFKSHYLNETFSENEIAFIYTAMTLDLYKLICTFDNSTYLKQKFDILFSDPYCFNFEETEMIRLFRSLQKLSEQQIQTLISLFDNLYRFLKFDNNFDDFLRTYRKTQGIQTYEINEKFTLIDTECKRRKWKLLYPTASNIIFTISMISYLKIDDIYFENAMLNSIAALKNMIEDTKSFTSLPIIVVFTKKNN
eukprot:gene10141-2560_t